MDDETDISSLIARVTGAERPQAASAAPQTATSDANADQFFPKSETAFTEVPVFRHWAS